MEIKYRNKTIIYDVRKSDTGYVLIDGLHSQEFEAVDGGSNNFLVKIGGRQVNIFVSDDDEHYYVWIEGRQFTFDKIGPEEKNFGQDEVSNGASRVLYPPMPGSVVKILANINQQVSEGAPLIIIEAMKMEMTLCASVDGMVTEINVKQGEQVNTNKLMIKIG